MLLRVFQDCLQSRNVELFCNSSAAHQRWYTQSQQVTDCLLSASGRGAGMDPVMALAASAARSAQQKNVVSGRGWMWLLAIRALLHRLDRHARENSSRRGAAASPASSATDEEDAAFAQAPDGPRSRCGRAGCVRLLRNWMSPTRKSMSRNTPGRLATSATNASASSSIADRGYPSSAA